MYVGHIHSGTGLLQVEAGIAVKISTLKLKDTIGANLYGMKDSKTMYASTIFVEQTMTIYGIMTGLDHLYTRGTSRLTNDGNLMANSGEEITGAYQLTSATVLAGGKMALNDTGYTTDNGVYLVADFIHIEHTGLFEIYPSGTVFGGVFDVEKSGTVLGLRLGYPPASGPGAGTSCSGAGGAAHGGNGGRGYSNCHHYCYGSTSIYDEVCLPITAGSGGAHGSHYLAEGGWGGSAIKVITRNAMYLEGTVDMDGANGVSGGAGGSGGSVWLDSEIIEGWGEVTANGGGGSNAYYNCYYYGGGGGGGRIRTYTGNYTHKVLYNQRYVTGGSGNYGSGGTGSLCDSSGDLCSNHGSFESGACICDPGYVGMDCQYNCTAAITCSGQGTCAQDGTCICEAGYVGHRCDSNCHDDTTCSGNGKCTAIGTCICDPCYLGDDCSNLCGGQGQCVGDKCECDECHLGEFCESECNDHGSCVDGICSCTDNWQEDKCTRPGCPSINTQSCSGHGICLAGIGTCVCDPGWSG